MLKYLKYYYILWFRILNSNLIINIIYSQKIGQKIKIL
jgi:hypothetical protein